MPPNYASQWSAIEGYINGKIRRGWDYLREKWIKVVEKDHNMASAEFLSRITAKDIETMFYDSVVGSTISDCSGRALLLHEIGKKMKLLKINDIWSIYEDSRGYLLSGEKVGLIEYISQFTPYGVDPVKKKLFFFLSLMQNQGFWVYRDFENLGTPVDYHEVRGHLRCQTVEIIDELLRNKIINHKDVSDEEDIEIRKAVFEAITLVSKISKKTSNDLHYFFWNIFRNCCRRDETHCHKCRKHLSLPDRYQILSPIRCIFSDICASANSKIKLSEHILNTNHY